MDISNIIRTRRRAKDMTQEELADVLGVTVSAVSLWECDKTMPDITLIPAICSVLEISADELLGIDLDKKEEAINKIVEEAFKYSNRGHLDEGIEILENGLKRYPDSFHLMCMLMHECFFKYNSDHDDLASRSRAIELGEKILEKSTDSDDRSSATQVLCFIYEKENPERAEMLLNKMGDIYTCREVLCTNVYHGKRQFEARQDLILTCLDFMAGDMHNNAYNAEVYTIREKAQIIEKLLAIYHTVFEDGDFGFHHTRLQDYETSLANHYADVKDAENTLVHLRNAANHAIEFVKFDGVEEMTRTSLVMRGHKSGGFSTNDKLNNAQRAKDAFANTRYDFVRDTEEFKAILANLDEYAGEWSKKE